MLLLNIIKLLYTYNIKFKKDKNKKRLIDFILKYLFFYLGLLF